MLRSFTIVGKEETLGMIEVIRPTWFESTVLWRFHAFRIIYFMSANEFSVGLSYTYWGLLDFVLKERGRTVCD
jgi:hypothetical protein